MSLFYDEKAFTHEVRHKLSIGTDEGELFYIRRSRWLLAFYSLFPLVPALLFGGLALIRAFGGRFLVSGLDQPNQLDALDVILLAIAIFLAIIWWRLPPVVVPKGSKPPLFTVRYLFPISIVILVGIVLFRYFEGGRVLVFDPLYATPGDWINVILIGLTVFCLIAWVLVLEEWRNNVLVLTKERVIYREDLFFIRRSRQEIRIDDIQQINFRQNTYPAVILRYAGLTIQSFSHRRIDFSYAANAKEMQNRIQTEVNALQKQQKPKAMRRMIETKVYDQKPPEAPAKPPQPVQTTFRDTSPVLSWLFPINPEIDEKTGTFTWRPANAYIVLLLLRPLLLLLAIEFAIFFFAGRGLLDPTWAVGFALAFLIGIGAWIFWLRENWINDVYILRRDQIIDVDKRPFGPEDRRSAPIDRIQNISFHTNFIETVLRYGTVRIQTGGSGEFTFNYVPDPRAVQAQISDYLAAHRKTAQERTFQDALTVVAEYHKVRRDIEPAVTLDTFNTNVDTRLTEEMPRVVEQNLQQQVTRAVDSAVMVRLRRRRQRSSRMELMRLLYQRQRRR